MNDIYQVIKNVRLSEKASMLQEQNNEVVFEVDRSANKIQIKAAVETVFDKKVVSVRTANYAGKIRRKRRADQGTTPSYKKAIVRLAEGETIDLI
ncbi:MAG: 50S ribosomal protein L23 [Luteolibacter sp.]